MQTISYSRYLCALLALVLAASIGAWAADLARVINPWVRATVAGQNVGSAYMDLTALAPVTLIGAESPIARKAELHNMTMDGGVMKMRPVAEIKLAEHQTVRLTPGGYHLMLIDIKRPLKAGERVPIKLIVQDQKGVRSTLAVDAEVRSATDGGAMHH